MTARLHPQRFQVYLINLDPTQGSEIQKTRPCVVISPDEMNRHLKTVIIAPLTSAGKQYPTRIPLAFAGKQGEIALDQIRTVDRLRLMKLLGTIDNAVSLQLCDALSEMFSI